MKEYLDRQVEIRQRAWDEAKSILDKATAEKRDLTAEESQTYDRINKELDDRAATIAKIREDEARELRFDAATREISDQVRPVSSAPVTDDTAIMRSLAKGEIRSAHFEKRDVVKTSAGSPVPTSFYDQVIGLARLAAPVLATSTVLNTNGGENLQIPSQAQYSTAAIVGEATAIAESDPVFNSFITMSAYKYSFLVQVSREMIEDAGVDILSFIASQAGAELGFRVGAALTTGTGTNEPKGIVTASSVGGTAAGTAVLAGNELIDLYYSLNGAARNLPNVGWMMNGKTIASVRKIKSTDGIYLFSPSLAVDVPDTLLGKQIFENPSMADLATTSKSVIVGHLPSYYVRQVGGIKIDVSDDFAFSADLRTFRCTFRVDGNLPQTSHIKHLLQP
jgi:HK97 family phage major capsid protein